LRIIQASIRVSNPSRRSYLRFFLGEATKNSQQRSAVPWTGKLSRVKRGRAGAPPHTSRERGVLLACFFLSLLWLDPAFPVVHAPSHLFHHLSLSPSTIPSLPLPAAPSGRPAPSPFPTCTTSPSFSIPSSPSNFYSSPFPLSPRPNHTHSVCVCPPWEREDRRREAGLAARLGLAGRPEDRAAPPCLQFSTSKLLARYSFSPPGLLLVA
jgi:hypothetical protein